MASQDELVQEYNKISASLKEHEAGAEKAKEARKEIARQLFELNGKGHVYDLGDGVPMIIVASKTKTYFFTPKEKWKKGGRKKKPATKKMIVHDQVVEVPAEEAKPEGRIVQAEAVLTARGSVEEKVPVPESAVVKTDPPEDEPTPVEASPEPVAEPEKKAEGSDPDIDELTAALAEIE